MKDAKRLASIVEKNLNSVEGSIGDFVFDKYLSEALLRGYISGDEAVTMCAIVISELKKRGVTIKKEPIDYSTSLIFDETNHLREDKTSELKDILLESMMMEPPEEKDYEKDAQEIFIEKVDDLGDLDIEVNDPTKYIEIAKNLGNLGVAEMVKLIDFLKKTAGEEVTLGRILDVVGEVTSGRTFWDISNAILKRAWNWDMSSHRKEKYFERAASDAYDRREFREDFE